MTIRHAKVISRSDLTPPPSMTARHAKSSHGPFSHLLCSQVAGAAGGAGGSQQEQLMALLQV
eukprot:988673-Prymnesium_polylepis.1